MVKMLNYECSTVCHVHYTVMILVFNGGLWLYDGLRLHTRGGARRYSEHQRSGGDTPSVCLSCAPHAG